MTTNVSVALKVQNNTEKQISNPSVYWFKPNHKYCKSIYTFANNKYTFVSIEIPVRQYLKVFIVFVYSLNQGYFMIFTL